MSSLKNRDISDKPICKERKVEIGKNKYIVESVFNGKERLQDKLLKLAEKKTIHEMGLD